MRARGQRVGREPRDRVAQGPRDVRDRGLGLLQRVGRLAATGQDGYLGPQQGTVVRGLHPAGDHRGLGRLAPDAVRDAQLLGVLGLRRLGRRPDLQGLHAPGHGRVPAPRVPHREAGQGSPGDRHDRAGGDPDAEGRRLEGRHHGDRFLSAQGHGRRAGSAGRITDRRRCDRAPRHQQRRRPARHPAVGEGAEPWVRAGSPRRHQRVRHRRVQGHERSEARRCRLRDEPRRRHVGAGGFERHAARLGGAARAEPIAVAGQRERQRQQRERERRTAATTGTATANRAARAPSAARPSRPPAPSPCPSRTP